MEDLLCYKILPAWNAATLPDAFQRKHNTQAGTWAQLRIDQGTLVFALLDEAGNETARDTYSPSHQPPRITPGLWHRIVSFSPDIACQLSFLCTAPDYYAKKHGLTRTHSEVIEAAAAIPAGRALDLGCGRGRNTLYLALKGWQVDAWDNEPKSLDTLRGLIAAEAVQGVSAAQVDLNQARITGEYDLILSTVVFMFLQPDSVESLITSMRQATRPGGYNLIVAAMDSPDHPCREPFAFTFQPGQLAARYADWEPIKVNEDVGTLHRLDEQGNRIQLRFATLLARRPAAG